MEFKTTRFRLSTLYIHVLLLAYLQTQCNAAGQWISHPSKTTNVREGTNVNLTWSYNLSSNRKIQRITFGVWNLPGFIKKKLVLATQTEVIKNTLVKGRMHFKGNLTNPGTATITILNVTLLDSKNYGIEIYTGMRHLPLKDNFSLLVYTFPWSPRILIKEIIFYSLRLLWQQINSNSRYPILMYTVWIRKNKSAWKRMNTTLKEYIVRLWGEGLYEFGVTAWNRWGESSLKVNDTILLSRVAASVPSTTDKIEYETRALFTANNTKNETQEVETRQNSFFGMFMTYILIVIALTVVVICGISVCVFVACYRRKNKGYTDRKRKRKAKSKQNEDVFITSPIMYEGSSFTGGKDPVEVTGGLITPFSRFEIPCSVHTTEVAPMKSFGHRNIRSGSSLSNLSYVDNRDDSNESFHFYQDIDDPTQAPALPLRNSIKKREVSCDRRKICKGDSLTRNNKHNRSGKKGIKEDTTGSKTATKKENHCQDQTKKGSQKPKESLNKPQQPIYYNKECDDSRRISRKCSSKSTCSQVGWEVCPENVYLLHRIGAGSFGQVWKGMVEGKAVAVKMLNEEATTSDRDDLLSELSVMKTLQPHPNVVKLKGCVTMATVTCNGLRFDPPLVFLELVSYGDLLGYLRKSRGEDDDYYIDKDLKSPKGPNPEHLFSFALDVAKGMAFLAENKIVHRDLAARNVLIGKRLRCKITDFGMARTLHGEDVYTKRTNGLFPVKWMALESLLFQTFTTCSDVWSYGVVLYEIFTLGGRPYAGMKGLEVVEMIKKGKRLPRPPHIYSKLYSLMLQCWSKNPCHRPDFPTLCRDVAELSKDHQKYFKLKEYDNQLYINVPTLNR